MSIFTTRNAIRVKSIFTGGLLRIISVLSSFIVSLFIIREYSIDLWGKVVYFLLVMDLAFSIINWGFGPYLDHKFTFHPHSVREYWLRSTISRSLLLIIFCIVIFLSRYPIEICFILAGWSLARFLYQSFDPVVLFNRNFGFSLAAEAIGLSFIIVPIIFLRKDLTVQTILELYLLSFAVRALITTLFYRDFFRGLKLSIPLSQLKDFFITAFPFLMLTLSGMLQQRTDLYICALYLKPDETAQYQVFLNFLLLSQVGASLLLTPFTKNIFRLPESSIKKLEKKFIRLGVMLSLASVVTIYVILEYGYQFHFPSIRYVMGYFYILMFYFYQMKIYGLRKVSKQSTIALYSFVGCAVNLTGSLLLIPSLGLDGALLAGMSTQVIIALLYHKDLLVKNQDLRFYIGE